MSDNPFVREDDAVAEAIYERERYNELVARKGFLANRIKNLCAIPDDTAFPDPETRDKWIEKLEAEQSDVVRKICLLEV